MGGLALRLAFDGIHVVVLEVPSGVGKGVCAISAHGEGRLTVTERDRHVSGDHRTLVTAVDTAAGRATAGKAEEVAGTGTHGSSPFAPMGLRQEWHELAHRVQAALFILPLEDKDLRGLNTSSKRSDIR